MFSLFRRKSLSAKEAYEIAKKHNPGMMAIICVEYEKYWCFNMIPKSCGGGYADSCTRMVSKRTGRYRLVPLGSRYWPTEPPIRIIEGKHPGEIEL